MIKSLIYYLTGGILGAVGGFLYWYFVGCTGESCAIWSSWWKSSAAGIVLGALGGGSLFDLLTYRQNKKSNTPQSTDNKNTNTGN